GLVDDAGHHLGNIDFAQALEEHHQGLGLRRVIGIVNEGLRIDALIPEILETFVAPRHRIVNVWLGGIAPLERLFGRRFGAVHPAGCGQTIFQELEPRLHFRARASVDEARKALLAECDHVSQLQPGKAAYPDGGCIGQRVGVDQVALEGQIECRHGFLVDACQQFARAGGGQDLIEKDCERGVRHGLQSKGRLAHLADAGAQGHDMLGAEVGMQRKAGLELVNRLGCNARRQNLVQALERVMIALEPGHAGFDAKPWPRRIRDTGQPGKGRQPAIGLITCDCRHGAISCAGPWWRTPGGDESNYTSAASGAGIETACPPGASASILESTPTWGTHCPCRETTGMPRSANTRRAFCTRLVLMTFLGLALGFLALGPRLAAEGAKPVTDADVRGLQSKFHEERGALEKSATKTKFSPELFKQVDLLAKKGETALAAGRLIEARDAFRVARWYLPVLPPDLPEHVVRVFGSMKLRHGGEITCIASSPAARN